MRSSFNGRSRRVTATAQPKVDETYDLKGLNLVAPDQVMPKGETPFTINSRRYADNDDDTSVAIRTRQGSAVLSVPVGETASASNEGTITGDIAITVDTQVAIPFGADSDGVLTKTELHIKKGVNTRGYVIIEIFTDSLDLPSQKIAQSSIAPSAINETYTDIEALFMDAPTIENGVNYWLVVRMQTLGVGSYSIAKTDGGQSVHITADGRATWLNEGYGARFKTYLSTAGFIKGFTKRYPETTESKTLFAMGDKVMQVSNAGVPTEVGSSIIDAASTVVRFLNIDERTVILDGVGNAQLWNDDDPVADIANVPTALGPPILGAFIEKRLLLVPKNDRTRIDFSALYAFDSWPSTNFLYIGNPLSQDDITGIRSYQDATTVFTKETKWTMTGSSIQSFIPIPHVGTKGAISDEAIAVGKQGIYFIADDRTINVWDGTKDLDVGFKIQPELDKILDLDKVRMHVYNNQLRIYYNKNPDVNVNHMLLLEIDEGQWFRDTGREVMGSMEWTHDNNELVEFSSKAGWLFFGEKTYSDLGKAIDFKYWTAYKSYGSGASKDRVKRFRPIVRPANSQYYLMVGKDIDFQDTPDMRPYLVDSGGAQWGTFNWGDGTTFGGSKLIDNTAAMSGRGKHTQYRFEHDGVEQPVNLLGYISLIKSGRPR